MFTNKTPWIILLIIWIAGSTWWHVCHIKQLCIEEAGPVQVASVNLSAGLVIADGGRLRLALTEDFGFAKSDPIANRRNIDISMDSLALYLLNNPERHLTITGFYKPGEINNTSATNLGIARAENIKEYLMQKGVPLSSITIVGKEKEDLAMSTAGDSVVGGIQFDFTAVVPKVDSAALAASTVAAAASTSMEAAAALSASTTAPETVTAMTEEDLAKSQRYASIFEPIDLYFPKGQSEYIKTDETKKFFKAAIRYLKENPGKQLRLTGFTDDQGPDDINLNLSKKRAEFVKMRLNKVGVPGNQVLVEAKGEANPKMPNTTEIGRKANRRVTVVVIK
ncbi:OmpA family protein [Arsenicibacter rosenii]|uniref:Flagellar motor protein MotB n=1 Tax=Arsenicibacter rosenii TaxID=1750698 RepID=A0A1S2VFD3_9BACT|nr:OmpA family protein [Arsenicibacter rosenii]OIN57419.1 flagellar motor protein MotB [Arsenicibacter rosenii]